MPQKSKDKSYRIRKASSKTMRIRFLFPLRFISSFSFSCSSQSINQLSNCNFLFSLLNQCTHFIHLTQTHAFMLSRGLDRDNLLLSNFIHTSSSLGFLNYSYLLFKFKEDPNIYLYNTMIRNLSESGTPKDAILLFSRIQAAGLRPDMYSFPCILKLVANLGTIRLGKVLHAQVFRIGFYADRYILTGLIRMYSACGEINDARRMFDEISDRDEILWNVMLDGYVKKDDLDNACKLFDQMPQRDVFAWTTLIGGYARMKKSEEAISLFRKMQLEDQIMPDEITLISVLSACADLGALDLGDWIRNYIKKHNLYNKGTPVMNALIDMYAKCGNIAKALEVFEKMSHRSIVTWTTMISGLALHGLCQEASAMFNRMERENVKPNEVSFLAILSACCHNGLTKLGRWYFDRMRSHYKIEPRIEHYGCMVDLLGRAGCLDEAIGLVREMPFDSNKAIWGSLLSSARTHNDAKLGEMALMHLIDLEPENSGNCILLSNIYASENRWDKVKELRRIMKEKGFMSVPGASSIEIDGMVHEFTSRDGSHPCLKEISEVIIGINGPLKASGYVPPFWEDLLEFEGCQ